MKQGMLAIGDLLKNFKSDEDKYISREFQKYGYDLAEELGDLKNKSLYIKLAKDTPRAMLEQARSFVKDAYEVKSKPRLFMWKLSELKRAKLTHKRSASEAENSYVEVETTERRTDK